MENDIIKFKGTIDGVKIYISPSASFSEITDALRKKLEEFRRFFGNGHCNIYFMSNNLKKSDMLRLESIVKAMLPESSIHYGEKKIIKQNPEEEAYNKEIPKPKDDDEEFKQIKEVVTANFKSSRARFYEGVVKSGREIESDGHLLLLGSVEKGAKVSAVGNVIILGKLEGTVEAGCMGNREAYIVAAEFNPESMMIAGVSGLNTNSEKSGFIKAVLTDNQIYTYEYLVK